MQFSVGDCVEKSGGDYRFSGVVVAGFAKRSGAVRYVVEDERGLLFIFNGDQLVAATTVAQYPQYQRYCPPRIPAVVPWQYDPGPTCSAK